MFKIQHVLILVFLSLIWLFPYLPLNDYPNHLAAVHIINQLIHGNEHLSEYFSFNLLTPASLAYIVLLLFNQFFSIEVSGKIFLSLYVLIYFFSMNYFYKSVKPNTNVNLTLLSLLFVFNWFFFMGFLGFLLSIPLYFLFLGYWYKHQENYLLIAFSLILLYFFHLITAVVFLVSILSLRPKFLTNPKFYASLLPFILLGIYFFYSYFSFSETEVFSGFFKSVSSVLYIRDFLFSKILSPVIFSYAGFSFIFLITIFLVQSKQMHIQGEFRNIFFILLVCYIVSLNDLPSWQFFSVRFLPFIFLIFLLFLPQFNKIDLKFINLFLALAFIISFIFYVYVFYQYNLEIEGFLKLRQFIPANSSIEYGFSVSRIDLNFLKVEPFLHASHYLILNKDGSFSNGIFTYSYDPLKSKKEIISDWSFFAKAIENHTLFEDPTKCNTYYTYANLLTDSEFYPQMDYIVFYKDTCNLSKYFINEYVLVYEDGKGTYLLKLKSNS